MPRARVSGSAWGGAARVLAATAGSYGVAVAVDIGLSRALPLAPSQAVTVATMAGVLAITAAAIWACAAATPGRAWAGLALVSAAMLLIGWIAAA